MGKDVAVMVKEEQKTDVKQMDSSSPTPGANQLQKETTNTRGPGLNEPPSQSFARFDKTPFETGPQASVAEESIFHESSPQEHAVVSIPTSQPLNQDIVIREFTRLVQSPQVGLFLVGYSMVSSLGLGRLWKAIKKGTSRREKNEVPSPGVHQLSVMYPRYDKIFVKTPTSGLGFARNVVAGATGKHGLKESCLATSLKFTKSPLYDEYEKIYNKKLQEKCLEETALSDQQRIQITIESAIEYFLEKLEDHPTFVTLRDHLGYGGNRVEIISILICSYFFEDLIPEEQQREKQEFEQSFAILVKVTLEFFAAPGPTPGQGKFSPAQAKAIKKALHLRKKIRKKFPAFGNVSHFFWYEIFNARVPVPLELLAGVQRPEAAHIVPAAICFIDSSDALVYRITVELHSIQTFLEGLDSLGDFDNINTAFKDFSFYATLARSINRRVSPDERLSIEQQQKSMYGISPENAKVLMDLEDLLRFISQSTKNLLKGKTEYPSDKEFTKEIQDWKEKFYTIAQRTFKELGYRFAAVPLETPSLPFSADLKTGSDLRAEEVVNEKEDEFRARLRKSLDDYVKANALFTSFIRSKGTIKNNFDRAHEMVIEAVRGRDSLYDNNPAITQQRDYITIFDRPPAEMLSFYVSEVTRAQQKILDLQEASAKAIQEKKGCSSKKRCSRSARVC